MDSRGLRRLAQWQSYRETRDRYLGSEPPFGPRLARCSESLGYALLGESARYRRNWPPTGEHGWRAVGVQEEEEEACHRSQLREARLLIFVECESKSELVGTASAIVDL